MNSTQYRFLIEHQPPIDIHIQQSGDGMVNSVDPGPVEFDERVTWLENATCEHCPLKRSRTPICPLARTVCPVVARFEKEHSYTPARVLVKTGARNYHRDTTVQGGLSSLLGLLMGGSGCPYMAFFRPMALFHLPFSTEEETVFRAMSNMTLAGYLLREANQPVDEVAMVTDVYRNIELLNRGVSQRLRGMTTSDATNNAIVLLDMFAKSIGSYVDAGLDAVRELYEPVLRHFSEPHENGRAIQRQ